MGQRYGQHFLSNPAILDKIAAAACPEDTDLVIEIGPGRGALTEYLLKRARRVIAVEIDTVLVHYLQNKFREHPNLTVLHQDVLKTDLAAYGPAVIAGNLPYYITSPILDRVFAAGGSWQRAVFLVQKEVAERVAAGPGSRDYGYLSVQTRLFSEPSILFPVSRGSFRPPPKVESAVFELVPHPAPLVRDTKAFLRFASACFRQKRKTLRNNLLPVYEKEAVDALPQAGTRAEALSLEELAAIWAELAGREITQSHRAQVES
ncbi:ribosomal RNA small subunit methyltransferase A [Bryobacterales bacterium F-183]|nr:ribosomal RNA small subunit methyltransferase A [Bryobacterales bacterium F-183]